MFEKVNVLFCQDYCRLSLPFALTFIKMDEFTPPPGFTTIRFDASADAEKAMEIMQTFVKEDIKYRDVPSCHGPMEILVEQHPVIRDVLIVPMKKLKGIVPSQKEIIVDRACGKAAMRGAHVFAPGIIGASQDLICGDRVSVYADLERKCLKGTMAYTGKKFFIGNGIAQFGRYDIFSSSDEKINGIGIRMNEPLYLSPCLDQSLLPNSFFPQNFPSTIVGHVLNPSPNSTVLDMCAAPGGKSTHLCSLLRGKGRVIAIDRSVGKLKKIIENGKRLGYSSILHVFAADSRDILSETAAKLDDPTRSDYSPPYPLCSFSYILLDAPCSGLGQRPILPNYGKTISEPSLSSYPIIQWLLFRTAIKLLCEGGTLVYSTCTTTFEENEGMVERVLNEYKQMKLVKQKPHIGGFGRKESSNLSVDQLTKLQYFDMSSSERKSNHPADNDTIGFFMAKFVKVS